MPPRNEIGAVRAAEPLCLADEDSRNYVHLPVFHRDAVAVVSFGIPEAASGTAHPRAALLDDHTSGNVFVVAVNADEAHDEIFDDRVCPLLRPRVRVDIVADGSAHGGGDGLADKLLVCNRGGWASARGGRGGRAARWRWRREHGAAHYRRRGRPGRSGWVTSRLRDSDELFPCQFRRTDTDSEGIWSLVSMLLELVTRYRFPL